ncbi:MAG: hypothetical protein AB7H43_03175 [Acidimicrobiia bacterium]
MSLVVDDQLGLLIRMDVLELPTDIDLPLLTVYGFQIRLALALLAERRSTGVLQGLFARYGSTIDDPEALLASTDRVIALDSNALVGEVALAKAELSCNLLAAEVVAAARHHDAPVRLAPGNASGQLAEVLARSGVQASVWRFEKSGPRLRVVEEF